ncbi:hypothetical protein DMP06_07900 [Slackia equolifaciens]|uniref:MBG domain-containing protein n=1 Tax=Slackia equolifaciens TaxID=498718 RepID=A0A3N0AVZ0_9ACTN|nr:hypothetical protein [Slackia equolifaciens]RNL39041.1 hypothetical protein DMP06_07900 [Slackia equolifaciens]
MVLTGTDKPLYSNVENEPGVVDTLGDITVVRPGEGTDENVDVYADALDATVEGLNPNYTYTVDKGNFTITAADGNEVTISHDATAEGFTKTYDGQPISIEATASKDGSTLWFSKDGETWSTEKPSITNVGTLTIYVKATNPNYKDSAVVSATIQVTARPVTITTNDAAKVFDGTELTNETYEVTSGSFVDGETYGVDFGDSGQTAVGVSENDATVVFAGEGNEYTAQADNYSVTVAPGTLQVFPQSIDPTDPDPENPDPDDPNPGDPDPDNPDQPFYTGATVDDPQDVDYNGEAQAWEPTVTNSQGVVLTKDVDYTVTYSEDVVNAGTVTVTIEGIGDYRGKVEKTYEIRQVELVITTPSASKTYDGTPLTADRYVVQGLQGDDDVVVDVYGSRTEVGQSTNAFAITDWVNTERGNYRVISNPGILTVNPAPADPDPTPDPTPDNPGGGDTPGTPTPGTDTPTTPTGTDEGADEGTEDDATAEEAIADDTIPMASGDRGTTESIADDATPLANGADQHENCWVHWVMILGLVLSVIYFAGVGIRRSRYTSDLHVYENQVLGVDDEQNPNQNAAA